MRNSPSQEVVVITGASGGIGRATVREFARRLGPAARIGLIARNTIALEAAKHEVEQYGGQALVLPTDVCRYEQVEAATEQVEHAFGPIDIWINDAMVSIFGPFLSMTPEEYQHITNVTYLGQVWGTHCALKRMLPRNRGTIVQVGSALAHRSIPLQSAYCGAKHAIAGFTESVRTELIHMKSSIHITEVDLPGVNTTQFTWTRNKMPQKPKPVGKIYQPEVAADAIYYAAHHTRKYFRVGFPTVESVEGQKVAAGLLDHYLSDAAWKGSLRKEAANPDKADNFWTPVNEDRGAHGPFDDKAKSKSMQVWANKNRTPLALAATAALALTAGITLAATKRNPK